ncbi:nitrogenase component 1 [Fusibacter bizertensis]
MNQIVELSKIRSNKGVKFTHAAATPGTHCPMHTALSVLLRLDGISSLVVGTSECSYYSKFVTMRSKGSLHYTYVLDEKEVVYGCREGVIDAIAEMDREGAAVILVLLTCVPALIGEDLEGIKYEVKERINANLLMIDVAHYKRNGYDDGFVYTMGQLAELSEVDEETDHDTIVSELTVLGNTKSTEINRLLTYITALGINVNYIESQRHVQDIAKTLTGSSVFLVLNAHYQQLVENLSEKKTISMYSLYNVYTSKEIFAVCEQMLIDFKIPVPEWLLSSYKNLLNAENKHINDKSKGAFAFGLLPVESFSLANYFAYLGHTVSFIHAERINASDEKSRKSLLENGQNPSIGFITNHSEFEKYIKSHQNLSVVEILSHHLDYTTINWTDALEEMAFDRSLKLIQVLESQRELDFEEK